MSPDPTVGAGFARPSDYRRPHCRRRAMLAQLIANAALVVSIAVAATAVSIGIARADVLAQTGHYSAQFAAATIVGLALAAMGGVTAVVAHERSRKTRRDD